MKRFLVRQSAQMVGGVCGAAAVAVALSAITTPHPHSLPEYLLALSARLHALAHGQFGDSLISGTPILDELNLHLPATLALIGCGGLIAIGVGIPLGLLFAFGAARRAAAPFMQIATATPLFCAGLAVAYAVSVLGGWPVSLTAPAPVSDGSELAWQFAAAPILTVGLAGATAVQLALRRAAEHSSGEAFRSGLKRLGLSAVEIELRYVLPQILAGLLARAGDIMLALVSAAVVAEWVFHRQGAADLFVKSVALGDWSQTAAILFVFAALTILACGLGRMAGYLLADEALT